MSFKTFIGAIFLVGFNCTFSGVAAQTSSVEPTPPSNPSEVQPGDRDSIKKRRQRRRRTERLRARKTCLKENPKFKTSDLEACIKKTIAQPDSAQ